MLRRFFAFALTLAAAPVVAQTSTPVQNFQTYVNQTIAPNSQNGVTPGNINTALNMLAPLFTICGSYDASEHCLLASSSIIGGLGYTPVNKTGDLLLGTLGLTLPNAPTFQSLQQSIADASSLRGYGFIGDGNTHPLSSITTFNGVSTVGWTLAQWQAVLPAATALTNEMDWASLQSFINAATGPIAIHFPASSPRAFFDQPIAVCNNSVAFFGAGNGTDSPSGLNAYPSGTANPLPAGTELVFKGGVDGITHCASATNPATNNNARAAKLEAHDLTLTSLVVNGTNAGIRDQNANFTYLSNVNINGFNGYCLYFNNPAGTRVNSTRCVEAQIVGSPSIGTGMYFVGSNSFVNHITDSLVQGYNTAYQWHSIATNGAIGIEDTQVLNSACGGVRTCLIIDSDTTNYGPFNYSFINMSVDATNQFLSAPSANDVLIIGGNWNLDPPNGTWGNATNDPPGNLFDFGTATGGAHMLRIRDINYIAGAATSTLAPVSLLTAEASASDVQISGWHVDQYFTAPRSAWFVTANGARNVSERDTTWLQQYAITGVPYGAVFYGSADPSLQFQSVGQGLPALSNCGTSPTLTPGSNNTEGTILEGSGSPTSCTLTFSLPIRNIAPDIELFGTQGAFPLTMTSSANTGFTFTHAAGSLTVHYRARPY